MERLSLKQKMIYTGLAGWMVALCWTVVCFWTTPANNCSIFSRLNLSHHPISVFFLPVFFILLSFSSYYAYVLFASGKTNEYNDSTLAKKLVNVFPFLVIVLALIIPTFNNYDFSFYFNSGKFMATNNLHIYNSSWPTVNYFFCPLFDANVVSGYMYGPLIGLLLYGLFLTAGGKFLFFYIIWKLLMLAGLIFCIFLTKRIIEIVHPGYFTAKKDSLLWLWISQPLIMWEWVASGHFESVWLPFLLAAVFFSLRRKWWLVFVFLTIGAWLKFLPILIAPWFVLWWWQDTNKANYKTNVIHVLIALACSFLITIMSWAPFWEGVSTIHPIQMQTKWAVNSLFSSTYYSIRPLFDKIFLINPHWYLTRLLHFSLLVLVVYLLYPLIKKALAVLIRKSFLSPTDYINAIFITFFVYLSVWQKSFWPWYVSWLLPFGFILLTEIRSKAFFRLLVWLSICPLYLYVVWMVGGIPFPSEKLWLQWLLMLLSWLVPFIFFLKWRKEGYNLNNL